jgi:4'-phosphopantetheinyl transferase
MQPVLTQWEKNQLALVPQQHLRRELLALWTRKESVLKATGHGLAIPPSSVEVSGPGVTPALRAWGAATPKEHVHLFGLDPGKGYTATLAVISAHRVRVRQRWTNPSAALSP